MVRPTRSEAVASGIRCWIRQTDDHAEDQLAIRAGKGAMATKAGAVSVRNEGGETGVASAAAEESKPSVYAHRQRA